MDPKLALNRCLPPNALWCAMLYINDMSEQLNTIVAMRSSKANDFQELRIYNLIMLTSV